MPGLMMNHSMLEATVAPRYTLTEAAAILQSVGATMVQPTLPNINNPASLLSQLSRPQQPFSVTMMPAQATMTCSDASTKAEPDNKPEPKIAFRLTGPPIRRFNHNRLGSHNSDRHNYHQKNHRNGMHHHNKNGGGRGAQGGSRGGGSHSGRRSSGRHWERGAYGRDGRHGGHHGKYSSNGHPGAHGGYHEQDWHGGPKTIQRTTRDDGSGHREERDGALHGGDIVRQREEPDRLPQRPHSTRRRSYNGGGRYHYNNTDVDTEEE